MLPEYNFDDDQLAVLEDMMSGAYASLFSNIGGNVATLSVEEIAEIRANLPKNLNNYVKNIAPTGKSLKGNVSYFWGGKYNNIGRNPDWGKEKLVTSPGSTTTGTYRPYGLDCSGYVSWVFINSGFPKGCNIKLFWQRFSYAMGLLHTSYANVGKNWRFSIQVCSWHCKLTLKKLLNQLKSI